MYMQLDDNSKEINYLRIFERHARKKIEVFCSAFFSSESTFFARKKENIASKLPAFFLSLDFNRAWKFSA